MRVPDVFVLLAAAACGTPVQDPDMRPLSAADAPATSALGALQTRDFKITFLTGDRLNVQDSHGVVLARQVTMAELEQIDAFLFAACTSAMARNGTYLDARLDHGGPAKNDDDRASDLRR